MSRDIIKTEKKKNMCSLLGDHREKCEMVITSMQCCLFYLICHNNSTSIPLVPDYSRSIANYNMVADTVLESECLISRPAV